MNGSLATSDVAMRLRSISHEIKIRAHAFCKRASSAVTNLCYSLKTFYLLNIVSAKKRKTNQETRSTTSVSKQQNVRIMTEIKLQLKTV